MDRAKLMSIVYALGIAPQELQISEDVKPGESRLALQIHPTDLMELMTEKNSDGGYIITDLRGGYPTKVLGMEMRYCKCKS